VSAVGALGAVAVVPLSAGGVVGSELGADWSVDCSADCDADVAGLVGFEACDVPDLRLDVPVDFACAGFVVLVAWARGERLVPPAWLLRVDDELAVWLSPLRRCELALDAFEPAGVVVRRT
jgi:hypothetical protein